MSCPDCFRGGITPNIPTGTETTIHGIPTYVAQPEDGVVPKGLIVFITDAFGWEFVNNRVLCDRYAKRGGFLVYCPDFMNGHAMDPKAIALIDQIMAPASWPTTIIYKPIYVIQTLMLAIPWKSKTKIPDTHPKIVSFLQALRTSPPPFTASSLQIGVAGYCWGGKHAILLAQDAASSRVQRHKFQQHSETPEKLIDCVFVAHPSYVEVPTDINAIALPISVAVGDEDSNMKIAVVKQMKDILEREGEKASEVVIFPGAKHGFAIRTHPDDVVEMESAEKAEVQAIEWFTRCFASNL